MGTADCFKAGESSSCSRATAGHALPHSCSTSRTQGCLRSRGITAPADSNGTWARPRDRGREKPCVLKLGNYTEASFEERKQSQNPRNKLKVTRDLPGSSNCLCRGSITRTAPPGQTPCSCETASSHLLEEEKGWRSHRQTRPGGGSYRCNVLHKSKMNRDSGGLIFFKNTHKKKMRRKYSLGDEAGGGQSVLLLLQEKDGVGCALEKMK